MSSVCEREKHLTKGFVMQYFCEIFIMKGIKTPTELSWLTSAM
jgi:hypothetical protein